MYEYRDTAAKVRQIGGIFLIGAIIVVGIFAYFAYTQFRIDIPAAHMGVLTRKTGVDIDNNDEVASDAEHKGLQLAVLPEGRYFLNPYVYDWKVYPMVDIPEGKLGVRIRLYGDDLPYGHFVATKENEKGIVEDVLRPGRYAINALLKEETDHQWKTINPRKTSDYVEIIELHEPVVINAGFKGVVTNLAGPIPTESNKLTVAKGQRGVQKDTLEPGTYYLNPYMYRIQPIDCRSQRFDISKGEDMGFPSKDGFWVTLDGVIEFRIKPGQEAECFIMYNEDINGTAAANIGDEIIKKVITPNARSFCRMEGSNSTGKQLIGGDTRVAFQTAFQKAIQESCEAQGVEVIQALLTKVKPPEAIAEPVRKCEIAKQQQQQFQEQKKQQEAEAALATQKALIDQKQKLVQADQKVVKVVQEAKQAQEVAMEGANRDLEVAIEELQAAKDKAAATLSEKQAEAAVTLYANEADASGWQRSIQALGGDGEAFARFVLYQKLAPSFKDLTVNTADSTLMKVFESFTKPGNSTKIDTSKIEPVKIDLPKDVQIPKIERKVRKVELPPAVIPPVSKPSTPTPVAAPAK